MWRLRFDTWFHRGYLGDTLGVMCPVYNQMFSGAWVARWGLGFRHCKSFWPCTSLQWIIDVHCAGPRCTVWSAYLVHGVLYGLLTWTKTFCWPNIPNSAHSLSLYFLYPILIDTFAYDTMTKDNKCAYQYNKCNIDFSGGMTQETLEWPDVSVIWGDKSSIGLMQ